jgi:hypothetical protein
VLTVLLPDPASVKERRVALARRGTELDHPPVIGRHIDPNGGDSRSSIKSIAVPRKPIG